MSCALVVALLHSFGPLARPYTWFLPLRLLNDVVGRAFSPFLLLASYVLGWSVRPTGKSELRRVIQGVREDRRRVSAMAAVGAVAFITASSSAYLWPGHTALDLASVFVGTAWILLALRYRGHDRQLRRGTTEIAVTLLSFLLVSYVFTIVKAHLFIVATPRDSVLIALEEQVFSTPLHRLVAAYARRHPDLVLLSDAVYFRIFEHMAVLSLFLSGVGSTVVRHRYTTALCLCYLLGAPSYFLLPTFGPVYYEPEAFEHLRQLPLFANEIQATLLNNTHGAVRRDLAEIRTYGFIAAMPSLHMAHELVMLHYARASSAFFILSGIFSALTALSVLVLGWHYALDVVGSLALAAMSIWLAERIGTRAYPACVAKVQVKQP